MCGTARVSLPKWSAARHAISASCSEVGSGTTPQSANISTRSPAVRPAAAGGDGTAIRKKEVRVRTSGMSPISHSAARSTSAVVRLAPATKQSARPARTLAAAWNRGSRARVSTSGGWRRSPRASLRARAARSTSAGSPGSMHSTPVSETSQRRAVERSASRAPIRLTCASRSRLRRSAARTTRSSPASANRSRWVRARAMRRMPSRTALTAAGRAPRGAAAPRPLSRPGGSPPRARERSARTRRAAAPPPRAARAPAAIRRGAPLP